MMCILGKDQIYCVDRDNTVFKISNLSFPRRKDPMSHLTDVLLDGEMVLDVHNGNKYPRLSELYTFLYKKEPDLKLHEASNDVEILRKCCFKLFK